MEFLFNQNEPKLNDEPDRLMNAARDMCGSDYILVKLCLDLWCEHGKVCVHEILSLDDGLFALTLKALEGLGKVS